MNQELQLDAEVVIARLRQKLSDKEWEVVLLEAQITALTNQESKGNDSAEA